MREPHLKIGFIIFNNEWKEELGSTNGHRKTAFNWIKEHNMMDVYKSVLGTNRIYDEEDFLMEYIGAIKLYAYSGYFYCRLPKMFRLEKSYLKRYYANLSYRIISDDVYDEEKPKSKVYKYEYSKTVINNKRGGLIYNPIKDGD